MEVLSLIIEIVLCVLALALIVLVLCQKSDRNGMSALTGGGEAIFGKGKKKGIEAKLVHFTKIIAIAMFVLSLALVLIQKFAA